MLLRQLLAAPLRVLLWLDDRLNPPQPPRPRPMATIRYPERPAASDRQKVRRQS